MAVKYWSINAMALEFGIDRRTVTGRLQNVKADGEFRSKPAWSLKVAAPAIFGSIQDGETIDPDQMKPTDRKAHYDAEFRKLDVEVREGELTEVADVEIEAADAFKKILAQMDTLSDQVERSAGLKPGQIEAVDAIVNKIKLAISNELGGDNSSSSA